MPAKKKRNKKLTWQDALDLFDQHQRARRIAETTRRVYAFELRYL